MSGQLTELLSPNDDGFPSTESRSRHTDPSYVLPVLSLVWSVGVGVLALCHYWHDLSLVSVVLTITLLVHNAHLILNSLGASSLMNLKSVEELISFGAKRSSRLSDQSARFASRLRRVSEVSSARTREFCDRSYSLGPAALSFTSRIVYSLPAPSIRIFSFASILWAVALTVWYTLYRHVQPSNLEGLPWWLQMLGVVGLVSSSFGAAFPHWAAEARISGACKYAIHRLIDDMKGDVDMTWDQLLVDVYNLDHLLEEVWSFGQAGHWKAFEMLGDLSMGFCGLLIVLSASNFSACELVGAVLLLWHCARFVWTIYDLSRITEMCKSTQTSSDSILNAARSQFVHALEKATTRTPESYGQAVVLQETKKACAFPFHDSFHHDEHWG